MTEIREYAILGFHYEGRRPVLQQLREGHMLEVAPEPTNQHDKNAVAIFAMFSRAEAIGVLGPDCVKDAAPGPVRFKLGYIARDLAPKVGEWIEHQPIRGELRFSPRGSPMARIEH